MNKNLLKRNRIKSPKPSRMRGTRTQKGRENLMIYIKMKRLLILEHQQSIWVSEFMINNQTYFSYKIFHTSLIIFLVKL